MSVYKENGLQVTSPAGRAFLIREEGLVPYAYRDPVGLVTFGVGHLVEPRHTRITLADKLAYGTPKLPRKRKAHRVFKRDLRKFEAAVRTAAGRDLPQHKFDALVSLAFNIGVNGFLESTAARRVRDQAGTQLVAAGIRMWSRPAILKPRREREANLYVHGTYGLD